MIEEVAEVIRVDENSVRVRVDRKTACGNCPVASSCGNGVMEKLFMRRNSVIEIELPAVTGVEIGDRLVVGVADNILITSSAIAYSIPLVGLFTGLLIAIGLSRWGQIESEWLQVLGLLLGLVGGFMGMIAVAQRLRAHPAFSPVFIRRFESCPSVFDEQQ